MIRFIVIKRKYHYHDTFHKTRTKLSEISFHPSPNLAQQQSASPPPHSSLHFAPSFASAKPYYSLQLGSRHLHQRIARAERANMVTWLIDATRSRLPTGITRKSLEDRGCTRKESQFSPSPFSFRWLSFHVLAQLNTIWAGFCSSKETREGKQGYLLHCYSCPRKCGLLRRRPIVGEGRKQVRRGRALLSWAKFTNLFTVCCEINPMERGNLTAIW